MRRNERDVGTTQAIRARGKHSAIIWKADKQEIETHRLHSADGRAHVRAENIEVR